MLANAFITSGAPLRKLRSWRCVERIELPMLRSEELIVYQSDQKRLTKAPAPRRPNLDSVEETRRERLLAMADREARDLRMPRPIDRPGKPWRCREA